MAGTLGTIMGQVRLDVRQAVASYAALRAQNQRTVYALRGAGDSFVQAGQTMGIAGGAMVYGFGKVVLAAAEFERRMDYASAVSGTTGEQMQKLSDYALQLGQDTIYSATEIADGFVELAKAGLSAEEIIGGIGQAMANLGAAGDIPLADAGQIITSTIQQFDLAAQDAVRVTDLLAGTANASIADIADIGVSLKYVGGVAAASGLSLEDTTTAISLLAKAGIRGSTAGTSLRQMIVSLGGATAPATDALKEIGVIAKDGSNAFYDMQGNTKPLSQVFQVLQDKLSGYNNKAKLAYLKTIFNNRALSAASILTRDGADGFKDMYKEMSKVSAADVAAERLDNLSGDIEILKGNLETLMVKTGGPFQETLRGWVQNITKLVQAFADLDPETQSFLLGAVGVGGAVLVAMGAFSLIVGTVLRFAASLLKLGSGLSFLWKILRIVVVNARWAAAIFGGPLIAAIGAITAPVWIAIGVIAALAAGFVLAYKKIEGFRNVVNSIAGGIANGAKAIFNFFKLLATDPGAAWDKIKQGASIAFDAIVAFFKSLPGRIASGLASAASAVGGFISRAVAFFASLPGKVLTLLGAFVTKLGEIFTMKNIGYAIGFMIGTVVRLFLSLGGKMLSLAGRAIGGVLKFFAKLPGRIGYFLGFMVGRAIGLMIKLGQKMIQLTVKAVTGTINFFRTLPGKVANFVKGMVIKGIALFLEFKQKAPQLAAQLVAGVVNFIKTLPSRIATFIQNMVTRAKTLFTQMKTNAIDMAKGLASGFKDAITGLPGTVSGIVGDMVEAFKGAISSAFNAAKDFAAGMWNGFKDGLGIHSPSHIERAMWQISKVMDTEQKKMSNNVMRVQKMSRTLGKTPWQVGDPEGAGTAAKYARLATTHSINQNRARTLQDSARTRRDGDRASSRKGEGKKMKWIDGTLKLDKSGKATVQGWAEEVVDSKSESDDRLGRMRKGH